MPIRSGDLFVLFTDGITEAMNASDDFYGEERLGRFIEAHEHLPSEELRERVLREVSAFVGDVPQHDDMTIILLRIGEPSDSAAGGAADDGPEVAAAVGATS